MNYPFTQEQAERAIRDWGCNCGPSALAFACQISLDHARAAIAGFDQKRYTSPSMMKAALGVLNVPFDDMPDPGIGDIMFSTLPALVRIQWTGPWTAATANPRWAYGHTHWIATWLKACGTECVFDINGGADTFQGWEREIVPHLLPKRGDGKWRPTHVWRLRKMPGGAR